MAEEVGTRSSTPNRRAFPLSGLSVSAAVSSGSFRPEPIVIRPYSSALRHLPPFTRHGTFIMNHLHLRSAILLGASFLASTAFGQVLYTPGGMVGNITGNNVGIGTTNPITAFHVSSSALPSTGVTIQNTGPGGGSFALVATQDGAGIGGGRFSVYDLAASAHRISIDRTGNVGIGTTNPLRALGINGGIMFQGVGGSNRAIHWADETTGAAPIMIQGFSTPGSEALAFSTNTFGNSGIERMRITASGNVGIGTTTPGLTLDVVGAHVGGTGLARFVGSAAAGYVSTDTTTATSASSGYLAKVGGTLVGQFDVDSTNLVSIKNRVFGTTPVIAIPSSGNVGIGTINPTNKLEVNGTIRTKEVIVETTGWSDYVFAPDYRLAPLAEVKAHIAAAGHLPGIPSAAEVAQHGVSVGDMQARLLAKVEEMTLHLIALSEKVDAQSAEIAALRAENATLRQR